MHTHVSILMCVFQNIAFIGLREIKVKDGNNFWCTSTKFNEFQLLRTKIGLLINFY